MVIRLVFNLYVCVYYICGDWGLGIGDCPIPNPQSPIPKQLFIIKALIIYNYIIL